jgi:L-lactate dehydrogenase complex protein LldG
MQEIKPREKVLKKVRSALIQKTPNPYPKLDFDSPLYAQDADEIPELVFAEHFSEAGGNFIFCENKMEFAESLLCLSMQRKWKNILCVEAQLSGFLKEIEFPHSENPATDAGETIITSCECVVTRTGSILISSANSYGRSLPFFATVHVVFATINQLVPDLKYAFAFIKTKYNNDLPSSMTLITGPSKTADIEGIVITGAQGPKELFLFLVDED